MPLDPRDLATLSRLIDEGWDVPAAELEAWLVALPPEHAHLRDRLREMILSGPSESQDMLARGPRLRGLGPDEIGAAAGDWVGPYRLIRELGRGGMGKVWLADRADDGVRRQVALKLPRLAWDDGLADRMARERDIGGLLEHPNIARLYDAGVDDKSRPYLAFEYVAGQALDAWSTARRPPIRDRLQLFLQVAYAVAYAHGRLVVHRDLKPSNVLVSDDGVAHLLDFGISKLLDEDAVGDSPLTQERGRMLTPHYASPEQLAGGLVTVASDVYSLGVLLYELLTSVRPFEGSGRSAAALEEAVLRGDPPLASSRVADKTVARRLRGELDAILAKALRLKPAQRYPTADALAQDIERHLAGEVVQARPDSIAYRWSKIVRRHWFGLAATAVVLIVVMVGGAAAIVQSQRASRQAERTREATEFVSELFRLNANDPASGTGTQSGATFVDRGASLIQTRFAKEPDMQAELLGAVSRVYGDMGADALAVDYAQRQLSVLETLAGTRAQQVSSLLLMCGARLHDEDDEAAEAVARRALGVADSNPELRLNALAWLALAQIENGRLDAARETIRAAVPIAETPGEARSASAARLLAARARLLVVENKFQESTSLYERALDLALQSEGPQSRLAQEVLESRAETLLTREQFDEARTVFERAMSISHQRGVGSRVGEFVATAQFWSTAYASNVLPFDLVRSALIKSHDSLVAMGGAVPPVVLARVDFQIGKMYTNWTDVKRARDWLEPSAKVLLASNPSIRTQRDIAIYQAKLTAYLGEDEISTEYMLEAIRLRERIYGRGSPLVSLDYVNYARGLTELGEFERAAKVLDETPTGPSSADYPFLSGEMIFARARLAYKSGDPRRAASMLPQFETLSEFTRLNRADLYGLIACHSGRPEEGLRLLMSALKKQESVGTYRNDPDVAEQRSETGLCALLAGDRVQARQLAIAARQTFDEEPLIGPRFQKPLIELEHKLGIEKQASATVR